MVVGVGSDPASSPMMWRTHSGRRQIEGTTKGISDVAKSPAKIRHLDGEARNAFNEYPGWADFIGNPDDFRSEIESGTHSMTGIAPHRTRDARMERIHPSIPFAEIHRVTVSLCDCESWVAMPENGTLMRVVLDGEGWTVPMDQIGKDAASGVGKQVCSNHLRYGVTGGVMKSIASILEGMPPSDTERGLTWRAGR